MSGTHQQSRCSADFNILWCSDAFYINNSSLGLCMIKLIKFVCVSLPRFTRSAWLRIGYVSWMHAVPISQYLASSCNCVIRTCKNWWECRFSMVTWFATAGRGYNGAGKVCWFDVAFVHPRQEHNQTNAENNTEKLTLPRLFWLQRSALVPQHFDMAANNYHNSDAMELLELVADVCAILCSAVQVD